MNQNSKVTNPIPNYQIIRDSQQQIKMPYRGYLNINDAYGNAADAKTCMASSDALINTSPENLGK